MRKPDKGFRMDPCLTQQIPVAMPPWRKYSGVPKIKGYSEVSSLTPILEKFFGKMPDSEGQIQSDNLFARLVEFEGSGSCIIETVGKKRNTAFCKVTHLLDPVRMIQSYYSHPVKGERRKSNKLKDPMNQAFIDSLANYLLGQLRERKLSPHFCIFYGGFQAIAEKYRYNITGEFDSYRRYKSFWERRRDGLFSLIVENDDDDDDNEKWLCETPSSLTSEEFTYSTPKSSKSERSFITLECDLSSDLSGAELYASGNLVELESIKSFASAKTMETESSDSEYSSDSEENNLSVYIELKNHPVMLIYQEEMEGVLDHLLEEEDGGDPQWEAKWTAWTFQIIAALCAAQGVLGFTHNDLHTNNIVWKETDEPWLWYKTRDGTVWRVPTFGKILCIIDFGRAIFRLEDTWFISDDYKKGGDAEGQYNFDSIRDLSEPLINPNPSFDLARYAVSIIEALYPEMPTEIIDAPLLSKEDTWEIHETVSPLWNLLWSWLIDEDGRNVLFNRDQTERFPDFDLYQHISEHCRAAKPQEQVFKDIFSSYKVKSKDVGDWETVYPLFC